jgi:putative colanic acid biosynthesis acetyltransferase WcaF
MAKEVYYNAAEHISTQTEADPYLCPPFSLRQRITRLIWTLCWIFLYRPSPRPFHFWRAFLLRAFGAKLGPNSRFYPNSKIWAPWNLICEDMVAIGNGTEIYNPGPIRFGSHAIVSQEGYICGATHDYNDPAFPLLAYAMEIGPYAWICARASVGPGVKVGEGAVLGLGSVATRDLEPWGVYAGLPAVKVKERKHTSKGVEPIFR